MTLEEKLYALLVAICPRVFPGFAPTNTARPYVTFQGIGGEAPQFLDATVASKRNSVKQISVWADDPAEATAIMLQIEEVLITTDVFQASPEAAAADDFDADMERYSSRQDFNIWADR
jgi:hypothetical protein